MWFQSPEYLRWSRMLLLREETLDLIARTIPLRAGLRVLEVGCGTGELLRALAARTDADFVGLDIDETLLAEAERERTPNVRFVHGDALALPFADDSFDAVLSHTFFTGVFRAETAMREMQRVCRRGGCIASITADCTRFVPHSGGVYPPYPWAEEFRALRARLDEAFHAEGQRWLTGVLPENMPRFFAAAGLAEVRVRSVGKLLCLSNEMPAFRRRWLELEYAAELTRAHLLPEPDAARYLELLLARMRDLSAPENRIWDWSGGAHLFLTGTNEKTLVSEATAAQSALPATVDALARLTGDDFTQRPQRAHAEAVASLTLRSRSAGAVCTGVGLTPEAAEADACRRMLGALALSRAETERRGVTVLPAAEAVRGNAALQADLRRLDPALAGADEAQLAAALAQWEDPTELRRFVRCGEGGEMVVPLALLSLCHDDTPFVGESEAAALTEAMYTICARHALKTLLRDRITPPQLCVDALPCAPGLRPVIGALRGSGVTLRCFDASCGLGIPALGLLLLRGGAARVLVCADRSPASALEKCLLAALRGRTIDSVVQGFTRIEDRAPSNAELLRLLRCGEGFLPASLLRLCADAPAEVWFDGDAYAYMLSLLRSLGTGLFVRDLSFGGFAAVQALAPGAGMAYDLGRERVLEYRLRRMAVPVLERLADASPEERELAMKYAALKLERPGEDSWSALTGQPEEKTLFGVPVDACILLGLYRISLGKAQEAAALFPAANPALRCLKQYLCHGDQRVAEALYPASTVREVLALIEDPWLPLREAR